MFRSVFRPYGLVWNILNVITDVLCLSLLWCFCCLPVLTAGAATTALYDSVVHGIRAKEEGCCRRFFRTFRAELKTSLAAGLFWGLVLGFGVYVLLLLHDLAPENRTAAMMEGGYLMLLLLPTAAACWSSLLLSRFTFRFRELTVTAVRFLFAHFLPSVGIGALAFFAVWYCVSYPIALTYAPAAAALGWSVLAEPVFRKYGSDLFPREKKPEEA